jgi:hypothetical protein
MRPSTTGFDRNVFINCPFDAEYVPLLRPLLFALTFCGLRPRIASERHDSADVRISKILSMMRECKYSIHDLSRMDGSTSHALPRFNMPFELGLYIGMRYAAAGKLSQKRCLVLERERYRYQAALSDISGNDIKAHEGNPEILVREVRNWLIGHVGFGIPSGTKIWVQFNEFAARFESETVRLGFLEADIQLMGPFEYLEFVHLLVDGLPKL